MTQILTPIAARAVLVGVAFYFSAKLGLALSFQPDYIAVFWPPNAIILTALVLTPPRQWWVYFLAMVPAYFVAAIEAGFSEQRAVIFFIANCLEVLIAAAALNRFLHQPPRFRQLKEVGVFIVFAVLLAPFVSATVASIATLNEPVPYAIAWRVWFFGDSLAHLALTPVLLTWIISWKDCFRDVSIARYAEAGGLTVGLVAISIHALGGEIGSYGNLPALVYMPLPLLLWAAIRFGPRASCSATFIVTVLAIWNAVTGRGPFTTLDPAGNVLSLQLFLMVISIPMMFLAAFIREHKQAALALRENIRARETAEIELKALNEDLGARIELRTRENKLILDAAGEGIYGVDLDGLCSFINPAAEKLLGWEAGELIGKPQHDVLHHTKPDGSHYPRAECPIYAAFMDGKVHTVDNEVFWRKNGSSFPVEYTSTPVFQGSETTGAVVVFRDITERRQAEERLRQSQKLEAVGQLTGGVAHDFNNILSIILGNAEMLQRKSGDEKENIADLIKAVKRGASLTQRLLSFSRTQTLSPEPTDICVLVEDIEDMLRRSLGETINLVVECSDEKCFALIDPHQLEHALLNLAVNARDAMKRGGVLTIEIDKVTLDETYAEQHDEVTPGDYMRIAVSDSGAGMPKDILEQAFEPFFTTKGVGEGSGLGLSMVYGFVKQSQGHITIDSKKGHGTTVTLFLPRSAEEVDEAADAEAELRELPRGKERILVVEDEEGVRKFTKTLLDGQGYEVVAAADGKEAVTHLKNEQMFDLLFTDVVLPEGMNGVEVAETAKRLQPNISVLYATGYMEDVIADNGELEEGTTLLKKPYESTELLEKISTILDQSSA